MKKILLMLPLTMGYSLAFALPGPAMLEMKWDSQHIRGQVYVAELASNIPPYTAEVSSSTGARYLNRTQGNRLTLNHPIDRKFRLKTLKVEVRKGPGSPKAVCPVTFSSSDPLLARIQLPPVDIRTRSSKIKDIEIKLPDAIYNRTQTVQATLTIACMNRPKLQLTINPGSYKAKAPSFPSGTKIRR